MKLATPPRSYNQIAEIERNRKLEAADLNNHKRDRDIEITNGARLILISPDGTRWSITVSNAGAISASAI